MPEHNPIRRHFPSVRWLFLLGMLLVTFVPGARAKVTVDFDPEVDFSKFRTFAFIGPVQNLVEIQINADLINTRMHDVVVRELGKKGLQEVRPDQNPDLVVRYWAVPESQVNVAVMGNWGPYGPYIEGSWGKVYNAMPTSNRRESTLILDLIDFKAKSLVWRSYLVRKLSDPDKDWKKAEEELTEGFRSYPPSDKDKAEKRKEHGKG